ncbi:hypothetical protein LZ30DRAFT_433135 [Colletotrichum cereale]|nr:hypothetical protein LZ30DRAFT_433135 [Colletotrichum cereale]
MAGAPDVQAVIVRGKAPTDRIPSPRHSSCAPPSCPCVHEPSRTKSRTRRYAKTCHHKCPRRQKVVIGAPSTQWYAMQGSRAVVRKKKQSSAHQPRQANNERSATTCLIPASYRDRHEPPRSKLDSWRAEYLCFMSHVRLWPANRPLAGSPAAIVRRPNPVDRHHGAAPRARAGHFTAVWLHVVAVLPVSGMCQSKTPGKEPRTPAGP